MVIPNSGFNPPHGGDLRSASRYFGIDETAWLDLSTGINPCSYPVPSLAAEWFQNLPYVQDAFTQASRAYYGISDDSIDSLPVNGTQSAIQRLPALLPRLPVLLPNVGYSEHQKAWQAQGLPLDYYPALDHTEAFQAIEAALMTRSARHLVIIHPNNPSGLTFSPAQLHRWAEQLSEGGVLILDEAFIDPTPEQSVLPHHFHPNMVVLRSFGKFFGLAGLRLGQCFAVPKRLEGLKATSHPWEINGPALAIATQAYQDPIWIQQSRQQIKAWTDQRRLQLATLFNPLGPVWQTHQSFFSCYLLEKNSALRLYEHLGAQGILTRYIPFSNTQSFIRLGQYAPQNRNAFERINKAFQTYCLLTRKTTVSG